MASIASVITRTGEVVRNLMKITTATQSVQQKEISGAEDGWPWTSIAVGNTIFTLLGLYEVVKVIVACHCVGIYKNRK